MKLDLKQIKNCNRFFLLAVGVALFIHNLRLQNLIIHLRYFCSGPCFTQARTTAPVQRVEIFSYQNLENLYQCWDFK